MPCQGRHRNNRSPAELVVPLALVLASVSAGPASAQLTSSDIAALRAQGLAEGWTFEVDLNPATERSLDELCGLLPPRDWLKRAPPDPSGALRGFDPAFDWREVTPLPPVRDQDGCGSCWAFATVGPLECNIKIKDGIDVDLSEQWLVSCNQDGWGCYGGFWAHEYHMFKTDPCNDTGAVLESAFPYSALDEYCFCPYTHEYQIEGWDYVGAHAGVPTVAAIKQALVDYGPLTVGCCVTSPFVAYSGGVFNACNEGPINHGVTLVGWDDDQGADGVWIIRNSWGPLWGEAGYMRIEYGCSSIGYAATYIDYRPRHGLKVYPGAGLASEGPVGGPFSPHSVTYFLENLGDEGFDYAVERTQLWVTPNHTSGYLPGHGTAQVTVSINPLALGLGCGRHLADVAFVNQTDHVGDTVRTVAVAVGASELQYEWTLDDDPGWSTEGQWALGQPVGGGGEHGSPDPTGGHTGNLVYGYNLLGDYASGAPEHHLTSTGIDCTGLSNVHLKFWRWLGVEQPLYDRASVRVSNDGADWQTVWSNPVEIADTSWVEMDLDIADVADGQPTVYLRWTMGATDDGWRYCGWNVDDIRLTAISSREPPSIVAAASVVLHGWEWPTRAEMVGGVIVEPRNNGVAELVVTFDKPMDAATAVPASVSVTGQVNGPYGGGLGVSLDDVGRVLTVTFDPALEDVDRYTVDLSGLRCSSAGLACPSPTFEVVALKGDLNRNGVVSTGDASIIKPHFGELYYQTDFALDFDADGEVTPLDFTLVKPLFGHVAP